MKKFFLLLFVLILSACGAMGIGSNHKTMIHNESGDTIIVTSDSGTYKVKPNNNINIYSKEHIAIQNNNKDCSQVNVESELNSGAVFLDIVPGILLGIIPIFVDAVTNNLYRMPETYSYNCAGQ